MRFIGSKELLVPEIIKLLKKKNLLKKKLKFLDAFCGTGSVSDSLKSHFHVIINDLIGWSVIYTKGRIHSHSCKFKNLGFDPFLYFKSNKKKIEGFFFKNYSMGGSERKYFTKENAARIDYFRHTIESWKKNKKINNNEYNYLLYCLINSISLVSNTAGVYGAYLKHWDARAKKEIEFIKVLSKYKKINKVNFYNNKIEDIISKINCDILYIDPPYTQNQYGTQYHLLETLVLNDKPKISKITGSRPVTPMRSNWSVNYKCHILLDKIISKTKAKYIIFSYSSDGFMSKKFIESCLKRYGNKETYTCQKLMHFKYKNFKSRSSKQHFEYLFFIEKNNKTETNYESPLNFIGSKSRMIKEIKKNIPNNLETFIDVFGGGLNVGLNIDAKKIIYNDINYIVKDLIESFKLEDTYKYILYMKKIIKKYNLKPKCSKSYLKLRNHYNSLPANKRSPMLLFTLILYGYNQQIRFNSEYNFNNPVGMRWFNEQVLEKMISFSRYIKEKKINFISKDFLNLNGEIKKNTFVYMDPPYLLTTSSYNDGKRGFKGWNDKTENELLKFTDKLNKNKIKFMISYLLKHKGRVNHKLSNWIKERNFKLINIKANTAVKREEVMILNYN
jgi:adenine-specific DNA-methyltransferase